MLDALHTGHSQREGHAGPGQQPQIVEAPLARPPLARLPEHPGRVDPMPERVQQHRTGVPAPHAGPLDPRRTRRTRRTRSRASDPPGIVVVLLVVVVAGLGLASRVRRRWGCRSLRTGGRQVIVEWRCPGREWGLRQHRRRRPRPCAQRAAHRRGMHPQSPADLHIGVSPLAQSPGPTQLPRAQRRWTTPSRHHPRRALPPRPASQRGHVLLAQTQHLGHPQATEPQPPQRHRRQVAHRRVPRRPPGNHPRPHGEQHLTVDLDQAQVPGIGHALQHGLCRNPNRHRQTIPKLNTFSRPTRRQNHSSRPYR